jgi:hypothetical protein
VKNQGLPFERFAWPMYSNNKHYECSVPFLLPQYSDKKNQEVDDYLEVPPFLESMQEKCIYRWEGWWTYEFCYGKHIRQFHQEQDGSIPAQFFLGQETGTTSGVPGPDYYSIEYEAGSTCDLTGKPRTCEIRIYCQQNSDVSMFTSIKEPSSCNYVVRIDTPHLCKHPKYTSKETDTEKILCFETPIPTEEEVLEEEQEAKKQRLLKQEQESKKHLKKQEDETINISN